MTQQQQVQALEAMTLMARATNAFLAATNRPYRVKSRGLVLSRRGGYVLLAIPEDGGAADWRPCAPPYSTMENERR